MHGVDWMSGLPRAHPPSTNQYSPGHAMLLTRYTDRPCIPIPHYFDDDSQATAMSGGGEAQQRSNAAMAARTQSPALPT